jgi:hypothetical protein
MPQPKRTQSAYAEVDISRALSAIDEGIFSSVRRAAAAYSIPRSTLQNRRAGITPKRDSTPKSRKLTKQEEAAIVQHIHDLCAQGYPPTLNGVREMANKLLAERDAGVVGRDWPSNFVQRTAALKDQFSRTHDHSRAICEGSIAEPYTIPQTPTNAAEPGSEFTAIRETVQGHQDTPPTVVIQALDQIQRGAEQIMHGAALIKAEFASMKQANEATTQRTRLHKKRIKKGGALSVTKGTALATQIEVGTQIRGGTQQAGRQADGNAQAKRGCRRCGRGGHNSRTCGRGTQ